MNRELKRSGWSRRRWVLTLAGGALAVLVALLLVIQFTGRVEQPIARGRPLLDWAVDLGNPVEETRTNANAAVLEIGPRGIPALLWALDRGDSLVGRAVEGAENRLPARLWRFLFSIFRPHEARQERAAAARALRVLGPAAEPAIPGLTAALSDRQPEVVVEVIGTLAGLGGSGATALAQALPGVSEATRLRIFVALGKMGEDSIPPLLDLLGSRDASGRLRARNALMTVVQDDARCFIRLQDEFPKQVAVVRLELVQLFGETQVSLRRSAVAVARALSDPDSDVRQYAANWIRLATGSRRELYGSSSKVRNSASKCRRSTGRPLPPVRRPYPAPNAAPRSDPGPKMS
jgi:hypothetical protein